MHLLMLIKLFNRLNPKEGLIFLNWLWKTEQQSHMLASIPQCLESSVPHWVMKGNLQAFNWVNLNAFMATKCKASSLATELRMLSFNWVKQKEQKMYEKVLC